MNFFLERFKFDTLISSPLEKTRRNSHRFVKSVSEKDAKLFCAALMNNSAQYD